MPGTNRPAVGIVPGRSIGAIALGETRSNVTAALVGSGYTAAPGTGPNATFTSRGVGVFTVFFDQGGAIVIQKFNDPTIKIAGISVDSTLRAAQAALPTWLTVRCPKTVTLLIAPLGHTYFEFPHGLDTANTAGFNGIGITAGKADRTFC